MSYDFERYDAVYSITTVNALVAKGWKLISVNNGSDPDTDRVCPVYTLGKPRAEDGVISPGIDVLVGKVPGRG